MKNRVHITFDTPEAAEALVALLQRKEWTESLLEIKIDEVTVKPQVEIEFFNNVHSLHSLNITTKE